MNNKLIEYFLLLILALLWGSSYLLTKIALQEIPPLTLVSLRVLIATIFLSFVLKLRKVKFLYDFVIWRKLLLQSFFNSIGAWTVLSWGQQYVGSAIASVLNSTAPLFVLIIYFITKNGEEVNRCKIMGALIGVSGVFISMSGEAQAIDSDDFAGMSACLFGAFLYGLSAIYGRNFKSIDSCFTAFGTLLWASVVLIPAALIFEQPKLISLSSKTVLCVLALSVCSTGIAFLIYFRLIKTLGSVGVASQAYLRSIVGVVLGVLVLNESMKYETYLGVTLCILGVVLINAPITRTFFKPLTPHK